MFTIEQVDDIIVKKDGVEFLTVKRKFGWGVTSRFYKKDRLILESYLIIPFIFQRVTIKYQDLPQKVELQKDSRLFYSMYYDNNILSIDLKYLRKPPFILYKNGFEIANISGLRLITFGGRAYKMETTIDNDEENTLLLILFLSQLRSFGR